MDIARPDIARRNRHKRFTFCTISVIVLVLITVWLLRLKPAVPSVDRSSLYLDVVKRGPMLREVRGAGVLVPEEIRWVSAASSGRVDRILLQAGVTVTADTVLVELSNPELDQAAFEAEELVRAGNAQLEKLKVQLESEQLTQRSVVASLKSDLDQAKLEAQADEELLKDGLVPSLTAKRSRAKADQLSARFELEQRRLEISAKSAEAQMLVQAVDLSKLCKQSELKKLQVAALKVRAGLDGVLQKVGDEKPLQVGQQVIAGATIARIANPAKLKAEIKIAETQAKDIQHGQIASVDTRNGVIPGHVVRIDPAVQNGTVTIDIAFDGPLPRGVRPDLSVDGTITLERLNDVLFVGRPVNVQPDSKVTVFKVIDDGKRAMRVPVDLSRSSVSNVEIVAGLQAGDQIILSDMTQWDSHDQVKLN